MLMQMFKDKAVVWAIVLGVVVGITQWLQRSRSKEAPPQTPIVQSQK